MSFKRHTQKKKHFNNRDFTKEEKEGNYKYRKSYERKTLGDYN